MNFGGASAFCCARQFVQARPGGHDIVDQGDGATGQVHIASEGGAQVLSSRVKRQLDLGRRIAHPAAGVVQRLQVEQATKMPGDQGRLVEAAFAQTVGVQGHGDDEFREGLRTDASGQAFGEKTRNGEFAPVFQGMYQAVERMCVEVHRFALCECRGAPQAGAAGLAMRRRQGALRAARFGQYRQIGEAAWAERPGLAACAAKQAGLRAEFARKI